MIYKNDFFFKILKMTSLENQLIYIKKQRAYAWAKFYEQFNNTHNREFMNYSQNLSILEYSDELPIHLIHEIESLNKELRISIECSICLDIIALGKLKISICGHKYCNDCFPKLDKCAICRRQFIKK